MPTTSCPECEEEVYVDIELEQGDNVSCDECHAKLVVVGLDPIEVDLADSDKDDFDDKDDLDEGYDY